MNHMYQTPTVAPPPMTKRSLACSSSFSPPSPRTVARAVHLSILSNRTPFARFPSYCEGLVMHCLLSLTSVTRLLAFSLYLRSQHSEYDFCFLFVGLRSLPFQCLNLSFPSTRCARGPSCVGHYPVRAMLASSLVALLSWLLRCVLVHPCLSL